MVQKTEDELNQRVASLESKFQQLSESQPATPQDPRRAFAEELASKLRESQSDWIRLGGEDAA